MRSSGKVRWAIGILAGSLVLAVAVSALAAEPKKKRVDNPHGKKAAGACVSCHISAPVKTGGRRPGVELRFGGDVVALCSSCHEGYRHMHPIKITTSPDMKKPQDLPLDKNGRITCITCHDVMERSGVHRKRKVTGRRLCLNCHVDSDILAQVNWYPARLEKGESGRLEIKVVEFRIPAGKNHLGDSVLLYYYARDVDAGNITFGTNILYDDGTNGDRVPRDSIYTLIEEAPKTGKKCRLVYTAWVMDANGRKSNTVTLAVEYR